MRVFSKKGMWLGKAAVILTLGTMVLNSPFSVGAAASVKTANQENRTKQVMQKQAHSLWSLTSEDFKDLQFLKKTLKDKKVVSLGENFHRVKEYSQIKIRLIKYLHEELGYDVIAFESGMMEAEAARINQDQLTPEMMMKGSIFQIWHSEETLELFNYIQEQAKTDHPLILAGYDMQLSSYYSTAFIGQWMSKISPETGAEFQKMDMEAIPAVYAAYGNQLEEKISPEKKAALKKVEAEYTPKYRAAMDFMKKHKKELLSMYPKEPKLVDMAVKMLADRVAFIRMMQKDAVDSYEYRDQIMAEHVEWLSRELYPNKKMILWAHNDHLAKNTSKMKTIEGGKWVNSFKSMGEILHQKLKDQMYVVGLYMNQGSAAKISTGEPFKIKRMPAGSLEYRVMQSGYSKSFIDLSAFKTKTKDTAWMWQPVYAAEDGMTSEVIAPMSMKFVPKEQYDGLIVIDQVHAPTPVKSTLEK
ncbi:erythromycin esterase [Paenibacillus sp. CAA11]|uniref:erythromycin esterase family protein n=1 Tax=Paenibacillus sp. CAA11 TaxID=1532905 RepID=UPI000D3ACAE5|nr:erythromycin esterase family protein [Paenibacillus sp. CAA11]AWB44669.1 erythromycin esterase [Paenibacillus sp. CAA11]